MANWVKNPMAGAIGLLIVDKTALRSSSQPINTLAIEIRHIKKVMKILSSVSRLFGKIIEVSLKRCRQIGLNFVKN